MRKKRDRMHRFLNATGSVGMARRVEYRAWWNMVARCTDPKNPNWKRYGESGIRVCDRWRDSFAAFYADMGRRPSRGHSIDRIDPYGNYEPANCRWATRKQQARNQRASRGSRLVTAFGVTRSVAQWSRVASLPYSTLYARLFRSGWEPEEAVPHA